MSERVDLHGLSIAKNLFDLVNDEISPGTGVNPDIFWKDLSRIVNDLESKNRSLLNKRDEIQEKLNKWHQSNKTYSLENYKKCLDEIDVEYEKVHNRIRRRAAGLAVPVIHPLVGG